MDTAHRTCVLNKKKRPPSRSWGGVPAARPHAAAARRSPTPSAAAPALPRRRVGPVSAPGAAAVACTSGDLGPLLCGPAAGPRHTLLDWGNNPWPSPPFGGGRGLQAKRHTPPNQPTDQQLPPQAQGMYWRGGGGSEGAGGGGGFGWDPPSFQGPPMAPAEGAAKDLKRKSSWHRRRRSKIVAVVSLRHWNGRRGGYPPLLLRCTAGLIHHCPEGTFKVGIGRGPAAVCPGLQAVREVSGQRCGR